MQGDGSPLEVANAITWLMPYVSPCNTSSLIEISGVNR